jgi:hypothetical protein
MSFSKVFGMSFTLALLVVICGLSINTNVVSADDPHCNLTADWVHCVGNNRPCHCFDKRNDIIPYSIEKTIALEYNRINVQRTYTDAAYIFDDNIRVTVPPFGIDFTGSAINIAYLYLGDPDVTDSYLILNSTYTKMVQENNVVTAYGLIYYKNLQDNHIFGSTQVIQFVFSNVRKITYIEFHPDTLSVVSNLPALGNNNVTYVCSRIQNECTGANLQYSSVSSCVSFMNSIPYGNPFQLGSGYSFLCRAFHEQLARSFPDIHCLHTGPLNLGPFVTPCN